MLGEVFEVRLRMYSTSSTTTQSPFRRVIPSEAEGSTQGRGFVLFILGRSLGFARDDR